MNELGKHIGVRQERSLKETLDNLGMESKVAEGNKIKPVSII